MKTIYSIDPAATPHTDLPLSTNSSFKMDDGQGADQNFHHDGDDGWSYNYPPEGIFTGTLNQDSLVCAIIMCIVGIVGLIGNSLMLRAWIKYPNLRNDFYTVFAALALIDMLFLVISVPSNISDMMELTEINTKMWCKASRYLTHASGFISAYLVVVLAGLRFILLVNRNTIPRPRAKHLLVISVIVYVVIFLISLQIIDLYSSLDGFCFFEPNEDLIKQIWLFNIFSAFVPLFFVFLLYLLSYILGKRFFADSYSPRERQKSCLVSSVVIAFIICQMPFRVITIKEAYVDTTDDETYLKILTIRDYFTCILMAGKAIRPILCARLTTDLGHAFDEVINCYCCQKPTNRLSGSQSTPVQPEILPGDDAPIPHPVADADPDPDPEVDLEAPSPLVDTPSRSRVGVDRTISTSSTISNNSQAPLIRHSSSSSPSEIEMT